MRGLTPSVPKMPKRVSTLSRKQTKFQRRSMITLILVSQATALALVKILEPEYHWNVSLEKH